MEKTAVGRKAPFYLVLGMKKKKKRSGSVFELFFACPLDYNSSKAFYQAL